MVSRSPRNDTVTLIAELLEEIGYEGVLNHAETDWVFTRGEGDEFHRISLPDSPYFPAQLARGSFVEQCGQKRWPGIRTEIRAAMARRNS